MGSWDGHESNSGPTSRSTPDHRLQSAAACPKKSSAQAFPPTTTTRVSGDVSAAEGLVFPPSGERSGDAASGVDLSEYEPGSKVVMDWKGEPMVIQPGDKLPNVQ